MLHQHQWSPISLSESPAVTKCVTSYGIIAFSAKNKYDSVRLTPEHRPFLSCCKRQRRKIGEAPLSVLLIERKNSNAFYDILCGRYSVKKSGRRQLITLLSELSCKERWCLLNSASFTDAFECTGYDYETLPRRLLLEQLFEKNRSLLCTIIGSLLPYFCHNPSREIGFPKGRLKCNMETKLQCAVRECCEETGYAPSEIKLVSTHRTVFETFVGSDNVMYRHVYFVAWVNTPLRPITKEQADEVCGVEWTPLDNVSNRIREYDKTKLCVLKRACDLLVKEEKRQRYVTYMSERRSAYSCSADATTNVEALGTIDGR